MNTKSIISVLLLALLPIFTSAQCSDLHKSKYCDYGGEYWQIDGQSKTGMFAQGDIHELNIVCYKGQDYRVSLCADNSDLTGKIEWQIYEEYREGYDTVVVRVSKEEKYVDCPDCDGTDPYCETCDGVGQIDSGEEIEVRDEIKKRKYRKVRKLVFDLTEQKDDSGNIIPYFEWTNILTHKLILAIKVPQLETSQKNLKAKDMICIGVRIDHMKTPKNGF